MSNFNVIDLNEYMRKGEVCTQIRDGKKLKTRPGDFANIISTKPFEVEEEKTLEFEEFKPAPLENAKEKVETNKVETNIDDFKFDHFQNEEIDINKIKNLGDNYKGHSKPEVKKPKEEVKEKVQITREEFERELNVENYDSRITLAKNIIRNEKMELEKKESYKQNEIKTTTDEFRKETEINNKIQNEQKKIKDTLNGINAWDMEFLANRHDERAKAFLESIKSFFEEDRKFLNSLIQDGKASDERKENLNRMEKSSRSDMIEIQKQITEFISVKYSEVKKLNKTDAEFRKLDEVIDKQTDDIKDESVDVMASDASTTPERATVSSVRNLKTENTINMPKSIFEQLKSDQYETEVETFKRAM